jgi:hypothetical protein
MRIFRDSNNVEWTVFEVRRQVPRADAAFSSTFGSDAWLCFETSTAKRRLPRFPQKWRELADSDLTRLLQEATPAPRSVWGLPDEVDGGSAAPRT